MFKVDFTNTETLNTNPIPAGTYRVSISSCKPNVSKAGNQMLSWSVQVEEGEYVGRRVFFHTVLTPDSLWKLKQTLQALGYTDEELSGEFEFDPEDVIGLESYAVVTQQTYQGAVSNNVQRLISEEAYKGPAATWTSKPAATTDEADIPFGASQPGAVEAAPQEELGDLPPMTPAAAEIAKVYNLSLENFEGRTGSGNDGIFTKQDVMTIVAQDHPQAEATNA